MSDTKDNWLDDALKKLFEDLYSTNYHPTDIDACGLHEKHTSQCHGCRHAKWSNIIKAELRGRLDSLTAKQAITRRMEQEKLEARIDELRMWQAAQEAGTTHRSSLAYRIAELKAALKKGAS